MPYNHAALLALAEALHQCEDAEGRAGEAERMLAEAQALREGRFGECSREVAEVRRVREAWQEKQSGQPSGAPHESK